MEEKVALLLGEVKYHPGELCLTIFRWKKVVSLFLVGRGNFYFSVIKV